jgi:quinolinate synthetase complex, A subunit
MGFTVTSLIDRIKTLKAAKNAVILAHTYQPPEIQDCADYVGDSYGLSVEATATKAETIIFCGVMFMAETAAILNPRTTVIIPEPMAGCPMAEMILPSDLVKLKAQHPGHAVVCYVNSTAEIKALSDVCCTSSNALAIVQKMPVDKGIIFVPDKHLGSYVEEKTGRAMVLWNGFCPTHAKIRPDMVSKAKAAHPRAIVMMHPEAPRESRERADQILSTGGMCLFVKNDPHEEFIIATENGIIHTLKKQNPGKHFYPIQGDITCPNMKKTTLDLVAGSLEGSAGKKVTIAPAIAEKARLTLVRMLEMSGK